METNKDCVSVWKHFRCSLCNDKESNMALGHLNISDYTAKCYWCGRYMEYLYTEIFMYEGKCNDSK